MTCKKTIHDTASLVKRILVKLPATRNDDYLLYFAVVANRDSKALNYSFGYVLTHFSEFELPPFETVRRSRQKIQERYPELAGSREARIIRAVKEKEYREFAREGIENG